MRALILLVVLLLTAASATAQFTNLPRGGCGAGSRQLGTVGAPRLGQPINLAWACTDRVSRPVIMLGLETAPAQVPNAIACMAPCFMVVSPFDFVPAPRGGVARFFANVPADAALVGARFAAQGFCNEGLRCLSFSQGLRVQIQR